tara:strand:+ start:226 stop:483 length:258 start_codon:yes stop_codon:yes gene_type:complete
MKKEKNANIVQLGNASMTTSPNMVIIAANTQWVPVPHAWPEARTLFGKISEINTQMTAPCPTACEAMKTRINVKLNVALASVLNP